MDNLNNPIQMELFPDYITKTIGKKSSKPEVKGIFLPTNRFSLSLCENARFTSTYQMPIVAGCSIDAPDDICCFYRVYNRSLTNVVPHFYTNDN